MSCQADRSRRDNFTMQALFGVDAEFGDLLPAESAYLQLSLLRVTVTDPLELQRRSQALLEEYQARSDAGWQAHRERPDVRHQAYRAAEAELGLDTRRRQRLREIAEAACLDYSMAESVAIAATPAGEDALAGAEEEGDVVWQRVPDRERTHVQIEAWRVDYNRVRPHSALGHLTPSELRTEGAGPRSARLSCRGTSLTNVAGHASQSGCSDEHLGL